MDTKSKVTFDALVEQIGRQAGENALLKGENADLREQIAALIQKHAAPKGPHIVKDANGTDG